ncbi:LRR receptor-like serine/threonine-protein kinase IOS1 [Mercurialis annua]|uniref:LRR receptor-like serine/threonine-protein kinase IOS1 n=1 Tax=Mercurialis annua TaxID=3986 RepID=UPI00215FB1AA|nr:LRR receptor-like serine/threonine-protein kinase IOS1 [Mercurialis annua]
MVFCLLLLIKFLCVLTLTVLIHGQDQSGFISLDCGLPEKTSYSDEITGLNYISDASFIETGISTSVSSEIRVFFKQLQYVRSFPDGVRNCYNVEVIKDRKYLIRAVFLYGNYDGLNKLPAFDLYIGPNKWDDIQIANITTRYSKEIIHVPNLNRISVCLVKIGPWTPFISALEIRPLQNGSYTTVSGSLSLFNRLDVGSLTGQAVRFPDDEYDRLWFPLNFEKGKIINTTETIKTGLDIKFEPPSTVMSTANVPINESEPLEFYIETGGNSYEFYVYMHFAEILRLEANQSRNFNISVDRKMWYGPVIPQYLSAVTIYSENPLPQGKYSFSLFKIGNSNLPPLINGIEVFGVVDLSQPQTDEDDVDAIMKIKSTYKITRNWQGDPCAPQDYVWQGLNCTNTSTHSSVITSLDLSSSELTGEIPSDISGLKSLASLDLSNNSLTGYVPGSLSKLPLKSLNLAGNNLTGKIPAVLRDKWQRGLLVLNTSGNPELCESDSCNKKKKKKNVTIPVAASIAGSLIIIVGMAMILWKVKRNKQQAVFVGPRNIEGETGREDLELKKRRFTVSEVQQMTNDFRRIIGRGGFGTVYHGYLDDLEVAVKVLSLSSIQGYREFQAEVKLLLRVHHKNLTSLVGYCYEQSYMVLIYEYMANGNLRDRLLDGSTKVLSWEGRLQIALEAAQGLEYLHNGCKPPIIHRDVKSTNILLNNNFQAKLADFGLSRAFPVEGGSHVSTTVAGTPGYLDPEYYVSNWLTEKSDVFSFGVVLLEIITSKPVISRTREKVHLIDCVSSMVEHGDVLGVVDPRLGEQFNVNSLWKVVELAMTCVSATSAERPTMTRVVIDLNECLAAEVERTRDADSSQSKCSAEFMTLAMHSGQTPLAR